jgi:serine/threonine protein kinase
MQVASKGAYALRRPRGHPRLPRLAILRILEQLFSCLVMLHQHDVIHLDVKLSNILVEEEADCKAPFDGTHFHGSIKLADFGCSKMRGEPVPQEWGTVAYMPPELAANEGARAHGCMDVWSAGCLAMELIKGTLATTQLPSIDICAKLKKKQLYQRIDKLPCDPGLRSVVRACLQYEPQARESAAAILHMIRGLQTAQAPPGWRDMYQPYKDAICPLL